jgi:hypothetical protein
MRTLPILSEADAVGRSRRHVSACQVHSRVALGHFRPALDVPVPRVFIEFLSGMGIGLASTAKRWPRAEAPGEKFFTSVFQKCVIYVCVSRTHKRGVRVVTNVEGGMRWKRRHHWTSAAEADGEIVGSRSPTLPDAGIKLAGDSRKRRWQSSPVHRKDPRRSRNTIAEGRPECFGVW